MEQSMIKFGKCDGKGFTSKNSLSNALRNFKKLNGTVFTAQAWKHETVQEEIGFVSYLYPETRSIFADVLQPEDRVIYRKAVDKKHDRPMCDDRPVPETERERALKAEIAQLKQRDVSDHFVPRNEKYVASAPDTSGYYDPFKELEQVKAELELANTKLSIINDNMTDYALEEKDPQECLDAIKGNDTVQAKAFIDVYASTISCHLDVTYLEDCSIDEIIHGLEAIAAGEPSTLEKAFEAAQNYVTSLGSDAKMDDKTLEEIEKIALEVGVASREWNKNSTEFRLRRMFPQEQVKTNTNTSIKNAFGDDVPF